jgi:hypothetical protein
VILFWQRIWFAPERRLEAVPTGRRSNLLRHPIQLTKSQHNCKKIARNSRKIAEKMEIVCDFFATYFHILKLSQKYRNLFSRKLIRRENLSGRCGALSKYEAPAVFCTKVISVKISCDLIAIFLNVIISSMQKNRRIIAFLLQHPHTIMPRWNKRFHLLRGCFHFGTRFFKAYLI